jgi:hypothetical protein
METRNSIVTIRKQVMDGRHWMLELRHNNKITSKKEFVRKTTFYREPYSRNMKKTMKMYTDSING